MKSLCFATTFALMMGMSVGICLADSPEPANTGEDSWTLRYRFEPGEVLRYRSTQVTEMVAQRGSATKTDVSTTRQTRRFEVMSVEDDGSAELRMRFEAVKMSRQTDDLPTVKYHSGMKADEVPRIYQPLARQLKKSAPRFLVRPRGTPVNEDGEIVQEDPGRTTGNGEDRSQPHAGSESGLLIPLPEQPVKVGDTWKYYQVVRLRVTEDVNRKVRLMTTYRLVSVDDAIARISFSTSPSVPLGSPAERAQLISAMPRGEIQFDTQLGRIRHRVSRNNNSVFGAMGPGTLIRASTEAVEQLLEDRSSVSTR